MNKLMRLSMQMDEIEFKYKTMLLAAGHKPPSLIKVNLEKPKVTIVAAKVVGRITDSDLSDLHELMSSKDPFYKEYMDNLYLSYNLDKKLFRINSRDGEIQEINNG